MRLNSYNALNAFAKQLERNISSDDFHTKVVITPSSVNEKGIVIKVSLLKTYLEQEPRGIHNTRMLRVRVSVSGSAESMTGLEQALSAIETLDRYLATPHLRLETDDGELQLTKGVPDSRILQTISQEDSFIDSPDSTNVQSVQDERIVIITYQEGAEK